MKIEQAVKKLRSFFYRHNRMPSHREICNLFGYATKASSYFLVSKLVKAGVVEKDAQGRLIPKKFFPQVPILGSIQAGFPNPAEEQLLDMVSVGKFLISRPEKSYILKVSGDSMIEAGIKPGDLVVVERERLPNHGDIVVAQIDNEFTLKYYQDKGGKVRLVPANKNYPILYPRENLTILGIVVSVIRKYH